MSATALQLNWSGVQFASTTITRVTSVAFDRGGESIEFSGDNDRFSTVIARNVSRPSCQIGSGDVATLMGLDGVGTIVANQHDALGASGGAINWSLVNSVHITSTNSGQWGNFAGGTAAFKSYSSDGQTNPLSFTRA